MYALPSLDTFIQLIRILDQRDTVRTVRDNCINYSRGIILIPESYYRPLISSDLELSHLRLFIAIDTERDSSTRDEFLRLTH